MSPRRTLSGPGNGAKTAFGVVLVLLVAVAMLWLVRARPGTEPFDPRSGADDGARGLVLLLERYGASVEVSRDLPPRASVRRVLVLQDNLSDGQRDELTRFVRSGGIAVLADPASPLAVGHGRALEPASPGTADGEIQSNLDRGECSIGALQHLRGLFVPEGFLLRPGSADTACFTSGAAAFAVARTDGSGVMVSLGDNHLLTNAYLRYGDNAGLATALLAPAEGSLVTIVLGTEAPKTSADIGSGDRTLLDLVRPGVWMALSQLTLAFVVFALARAVRPGRPVREPDQVPIAGSELVSATGRLMQRAGHAARAGALLREQLHRDLCDRCRLPHTTPIAALDAAVAARADVPAGAVAAVLQREVADDAQLLDLTHRIQEIRDLVLEGAVR